MTARTKAKVTIKNDGFEGFIRRAREHAKALDRSESLPSEITITFETPTEMMRVFTPKRADLLEKLTQNGRQPLQVLASRLRRKRTAVSRDVGVLRRMGVLATSAENNPGHGKRMIVAPLASRYEFFCRVGGKKQQASR